MQSFFSLTVYINAGWEVGVLCAMQALRYPVTRQVVAPPSSTAFILYSRPQIRGEGQCRGLCRVWGTRPKSGL